MCGFYKQNAGLNYRTENGHTYNLKMQELNTYNTNKPKFHTNFTAD